MPTESSMKQLQSLLDDSDAPSRIPSLLDQKEMEIDITAILHGSVSYGDGPDTRVRSRKILATGVAQILAGQPSEVFLKYIALRITEALNENGGSLDKAFGLTKPAGRRKIDPQEHDEVVSAYLSEQHRLRETCSELPPSKQFKKCIAAAYEAKHGYQPDRQVELRRVSHETAEDRLEAIKAIIKNRGYSAKDFKN